MRAMILAAGRGERLRPLTDNVPKPLLRVEGKPLIVHHLEKLAQAGFREIVINLAHLGDIIRDTLGSGSAWNLNIHYSLESPQALDTGGGIEQALPLLGKAPFAVINADIFTQYPRTRLRAIKCDHAHLIMVPNPARNPHGDFALTCGRIDPDGEPRYTFSGISVYHPRFFTAKSAGCFSIVPMLISAAKTHKVTGELYRGDWHDIGTVQQLESFRVPRPGIN